MTIWIRLEIELHDQDQQQNNILEETAEIEWKWNQTEEVVEVDKSHIEKAVKVQWNNQGNLAEVGWINPEEAAEADLELSLGGIVELDKNHIEKTAEVEWKNNLDLHMLQTIMHQMKMNVN